MSKVRDILGPDKESEFLQSFVRVGLSADAEDHEPHKSIYKQTRSRASLPKQTSEIRSDASDSKSPRRSRSSITFDFGVKGRRKKTRDLYEEMYTDKDRAAAVSYGQYCCYPRPCGRWFFRTVFFFFKLNITFYYRKFRYKAKFCYEKKTG